MKLLISIFLLLFLCSCGPALPQYLGGGGGDDVGPDERSSTIPRYDPGNRPLEPTEFIPPDPDSRTEKPAIGCPNGCTTHVTGCNIKGNVTVDTKEKIYHVPGGAYYTATVIDPKYGERWFCTEAEAKANGWRRSSK